MKYDLKHRFDESLQITDFQNKLELKEDIIESIKQLRQYESLEIYGKADLIENLIHELHGIRIESKSDKLTFGQIDFDGGCFDYDEIYIMSIDAEYRIWVEPTYYFNEKNNRYSLFINSEAVLSYVYQEDCKQDLIDKLEENEVPTLLFGFVGD